MDLKKVNLHAKGLCHEYRTEEFGIHSHLSPRLSAEHFGVGVKNEKGAIIATTLIVLAMILSIALGVTLVSIQERKGSIGTSESSRAYQNADTGIELVMNQIIRGGHINVNEIQVPPASCNGSGRFEASGKYFVELKDGAGAKINCYSATAISGVVSIKSTGISSQDSRSIEVRVVP